MGGCTHHKSRMENMRWLEMTSFPLATKAEAWMKPSNIAASVWFVWINCFFVANQLTDCFGSFFPRCFQKKPKHLSCSPPKIKCSIYIFFQLNLYRCFFCCSAPWKFHLVIQRFLPKACVLQDYGRYVFGRGFARWWFVFFFGVNFPRLFTFRCILYKNTCDIRI